MAMERARVDKEEPAIIWQDQYIAVITKGPGWVCAVSRNIEQNKAIWRIRPSLKVNELVNSGKAEHLAHYVILKWKDDKEFQLAVDVEKEFGIAHRLDVDTSGALLIGKTMAGFDYLRQSFSRHEVYKEYICLCHGMVKATTDEVELPIAWDENANVSYISKEKGQWAKSIYTVIGRYRLKGKRKVFTLCRVVIITGRTHQIRIHMTSIGHPLVSDSKYNYTTSRTDSLWCPRMFLHAWRVGFYDFNNGWREVKAPLTKDLTRALRTLEEVKIEPTFDSSPTSRVLQPSGYKGANQENVPPRVNNGHANLGEDPKRISAPPEFQATDFPPPPPPLGAKGIYGPSAAPTPTRTKSGQEAPPPPPPPPPRPAVKSPTAISPAAPVEDAKVKELVRLPNGRLLKVPDYAPPPPPPPPPPAAAGPSPSAARIRQLGQAPDHAPPPPPKASEEAPPPRAQVEDFAPPPRGTELRLPDFPESANASPMAGTAVADPIDLIPWETPTAKKKQSPSSQGAGGKSPANKAKPSDCSPKKAVSSEQSGLEESACNLAMRQILNSPKCQLPMHRLGDCREISAIMQKMGKGRPKLSKLLRDRPDTFTLIEPKNGLEIFVTLSDRAMALGRAEQVSTLKSASDTFAAQATQQANRARERQKDEEEKRLTEISQTSQVPVTPTRRWGQDAGGYEEATQTLVEMGFDRRHAIKALRANYGDVMEAMDMLANMPAVDDSPPRGTTDEPRAPVDAKDKEADEEKTEEEEMLAKALAESQREAEEFAFRRQHQEAQDDQALAAVLALSLRDSKNSESWTFEDEAFEEAPEENDGEKELREALELSRQDEDERRRREEEEDEELKKALRESERIYASFHNASQLLADDLMHFLSMGASSSGSGSNEAKELDKSTCDAEKDKLEMLCGLYPDDPDEDYDEVLERVIRMSESEASASHQGAASSCSRPHNEPSGSASSTGPPPRSSSQTFDEEADGMNAPFYDAEEEEDGDTMETLPGDSRGFGKWFGKSGPSVDASAEMAPSASSSSSSCVGTDKKVSKAHPQVSLREWALNRMDELEVEFEKEVLWGVIDAIDDESLCDEEAIKMWLGFSEEDELPGSIGKLLAEFRQEKLLRQFGQ